MITPASGVLRSFAKGESSTRCALITKFPIQEVPLRLINDWTRIGRCDKKSFGFTAKDI